MQKPMLQWKNLQEIIKIYMMQKAIILGAGTYGHVYAEYLKNSYHIIGYIDDDESLVGKAFNGIKVLGDRNFLFKKIDKDVAVFVPIGNNDIRVGLLQQLNRLDFETPSFIHSQTIIHNSVKIGNACYILPNSCIMPCTILNDFVMVSMGVNIAHHNIIEDGCFFSQGSNIGASVHIKRKSYFGINSTLMTGVKNVGENALIGAGAVVVKDVPDYAVMAGVPAKVLRYKDVSPILKV